MARMHRIEFRHIALSVAILLAALLPAYTATHALAHGGEDHGDGKAAAVTSALPRVATHSNSFELVAVPKPRDGGVLQIFLTDYLTNERIVGAKVDVTRGANLTTAEENTDGYVIKAPWVTQPGTSNLIFSIVAGKTSDLLIGKLVIPAPAPQVARHDSLWEHVPPLIAELHVETNWVVGAGIAAVLLMLLSTLKWLRFVRPVLVAAAVFCGLSSAAMSAVLFGKEPPAGAAPARPAVANLDLPDTSRRLENGSLYVPKATQSLLGVATVKTSAARSADTTVRLIGRVLPDINVNGLVQASQAGRIAPPPKGFPAVGSAVKKGELLGYLVPQVDVVNRSDIRQAQGELDREIALGEAKLKRMEALSGKAIPAAQVSDMRIEVDALRQKRAYLEPVLVEKIELRAPVAGVIAEATLSEGQVVEPQAKLYHIIDPKNLWVEALAFDAADAAGIEKAASDAYAETAGGRRFELTFSGRSMTLREQAVPLRFRVKNAGDTPLSIGETVSVVAASGQSLSAIAVPRESLVRSSSGQTIVWTHVDVERFEPRVVKTTPIDAVHAGIVAGLEPGLRIVTRGAELINQVR
jgi:membrane fusion protein, heavy metal efflux system